MRTRVLALATTMLLAACEPARGAPLVCGEERALFFAHVVPGSADELLGAAMLVENGTRFLLVSSDCEYWAYRGDQTPYVRWAPVRHGVLDDAMLREMNADLFAVPWPDGEESGFDDIVDDGGPGSSFWRVGRRVSRCRDCDG
ncbi:hypothetical protein [Sandaracinus amylolyticus]|uniref:hypothetical protein n=1 Tax=Sandaracinus amylolyticus TaxID=927083 RepID=UPI0012EDDFF7|nr:hypothetical protein [Sandaracinus amylolyticus]